ncbi:hypothetical protein [Blastopirellula marina]|uniref:Uncharacterized protein n=1 Tax=Blastopirellula marina TaxID=124 RepID=A0A2S8GSQ5_9BACT|nr:hypothetical protein [Blastopirellula marina]PQO47455.1 hypothetical protein C5Y93_05270 [Blastopirellula marina]
MVWLVVGGAVCLGLLLLWLVTIAVIYFWMLWDVVMTDQRIEASGTPVMAVPVVVNADVLRGKRKSAPAWVIFTPESPSPELADEMRQLATELYDLYVATGPPLAKLSNAQRQFSDWMKNDKFQKGRRIAVPRELTLGRVLYLADVWLAGRDLPPNLEFSRVLACRVTGTDAGEIMAIPREEEDAKRIYAATASCLADEMGPIRSVQQVN